MRTIFGLLERVIAQALVEPGRVAGGGHAAAGGDARLVGVVEGGRGRTTLSFDPPLDLGLRVDDTVSQGILHHDVRTGDRDFDRVFRVVADDDVRATALLGPDLRGLLLEARARDLEVVLDDAGVVAGGAPDAPTRATAERIGHLVEEARARVPCPVVLRELRTVLTSFGARRGLAFDSTPLRLSGRLEGMGVRLTVARTGLDEHAVTISVDPPALLDLGLLLVREGSAMAALARSRGVALGSTGRGVLEGLFVGCTRDPEALARAVDLTVAEGLIRCARLARDVVVTDEQMVVELGTSREALREPVDVLSAATAVVRQLDQNVRQGRARAGPYR